MSVEVYVGAPHVVGIYLTLVVEELSAMAD